MQMINRFGTGEIYTMDELIKEGSIKDIPLIYCTSTACMSVTSDMLSWASKHTSEKVAFVSNNKPGYNNIIIVLGCQVTHLAILNDIKTAERLHEENPSAQVYMGGCLAMRFDIELPSFIRRLNVVREEYEPISFELTKKVQWEKPFWVTKWFEKDDELADGHLFRNHYPLKIGAGCGFNCKYCTIKDTRGEGFETDAYLQVKEFIDHDNIVLISDSPTVKQIKDWAYLANRYNKAISIRNVEPHITCACEDTLINLAEAGLLNIYHSPVQHNSEKVLIAMNRDTKSTFKAIEIMQKLRKFGVTVATNIIINYTVEEDGELHDTENPSLTWLNDNFDYWSWNPYFDGVFNREKAEKEFQYYISDERSIQDILNKVDR